MNWKNQLVQTFKAGISNSFLLHGNVFDYVEPGKELVDSLDQLATELKVEEVWVHSPHEGWLEKQSNEHKGNLRAFSELAHEQKPKLFVITYGEFTFSRHAEMSLMTLIHSWLMDYSFVSSNHVLVIVTETLTELHPLLLHPSTNAIPILLDYPTVEERLTMIDFLIDTSEKSFTWEISSRQFAVLTSGLMYRAIEDIFLQAEFEKRLNAEMVKKKKRALIQKEFGDVVELYETDMCSLEEFAGQEHIKAYHREMVIEPILQGDYHLVPKGILYMGPPGTGKTYFSKCLAGEAKINFVEFRMSKILDKWVGSSEQRLEKALRCFSSLAPVGVFIDEIEQALSRGGEHTGNPVTGVLFGMFLNYMSKEELRGKVFFIGATNYPNLLDEALKRAGRFDKKVAFFPPTASERMVVFAIHAGKYVDPKNPIDYKTISERTEGYTPAEIEGVVIKGLELMRRRKLPYLTTSLLHQALDYMIPTTNDKIEEMVTIALKEVNDLELLPLQYHERKRALR